MGLTAVDPRQQKKNKGKDSSDQEEGLREIFRRYFR